MGFRLVQCWERGWKRAKKLEGEIHWNSGVREGYGSWAKRGISVLVKVHMEKVFAFPGG